jgi:hypothetical protein
MVYEDLQRTQIADAKVSGKELQVRFFLMALHTLKVYPTEAQREATFHYSPSYARKWVWFYVEKVASLKAEKIVWPADNFGNDAKWVISVDGTHFWIQEPQHPEWSQDEKYYSHKYNKAGLNYELALDLTCNRLVWMNGPFPAGTNDMKVFIDHGLKDKLIAAKKVAIGDGGYSGHPEVVSSPNPLDDYDVKLFKSRALKRQEKFNGHIKTFHALDGRFRHSIGRFKSVFEAVCVICQYQIETDKPLFDILVEGIL